MQKAGVNLKINRCVQRNETEEVSFRADKERE